MKLLRYVTILSSGFVFISIISSRARGDITIDSFQDAQGPFVAGYGGGVGGLPTGALEASYPHVLGGRGLLLTATTPGIFGGAENIVNINSTDAPDVLEYESVDVSDGGTLTLWYGNEYTSVATSLDLNVSSAADLLQINFASYNHADGQDMDIDTTVSTGTGYSVDIPASLSIAGSQNLDIPLTSFSPHTIDYLTFGFTAPPGTSFDLSSIEFVTPAPEPTIAGALILPFLWRRK